jgi:ATP-dependent RNA helicase DeaD
MKDPKAVHATKMVDPTKLKQTYYNVPGKLKKELLVHLLKKEKSDLVMVFCNTRRATEMVVTVLKSKGVKAAAIHGGLPQAKRLKIIDLFHKGKFQVLVCTDFAARGLHIEGVTHIYNFDIPIEPLDYVHRIGRTARAGKRGLVINILAYRDHDNFSRLIETYREFNIQKEERPYLKASTENDSSRTYSRGKRGYQRSNTNRHRKKAQRNSRRKYNS